MGCCRGYFDPVRGSVSHSAPSAVGSNFSSRRQASRRAGAWAVHSSSAPMFFQEKEIYRWPARESLKTMLAVGWTVERTKEGEALVQQRENEKLRSVSQASQVRPSGPEANAGPVEPMENLGTLSPGSRDKAHHP